MGSIARFPAADWGGSTSVDCKLEVQDGQFNACTVEAIPVRLDYIDNGLADIRGSIRSDDKVLVEFREVSVKHPCVDVGTVVDKGLWGSAYGFAILLEFKDAVVNVVAVVHGNVAVQWLRAPYLGRNIDDKGRQGKVVRRGKVRGAKGGGVE